jgi:hypothetical protein
MAVDLTDLAELKVRAGGNKYGARRTEVDGHVFPSQAEAKRYTQLKLCETGCYISDLRLQPSYELQPSFTDTSGHRQPAIRYTADFAYREPGNPHEVVEEVKGFLDKSAAIRIRLFLFRHREVDFRLIRD